MKIYCTYKHTYMYMYTYMYVRVCALRLGGKDLNDGMRFGEVMEAFGCSMNRACTFRKGVRDGTTGCRMISVMRSQ
jgi:hypothetical protein